MRRATIVVLTLAPLLPVGLPALSADARAVLAAHADGVNAWVADHPLPPEYGALSLTSVRPWTALDSVAVGKLQAFGLSFDLDIELTTALLGYQQAGQAAGFDGTALFFQDLWRSEPFTDASTVPDAGRLAERYAAVARVPLLRQALAQDRGQTGSNQWAISGREAAGGHPLLANDPHFQAAFSASADQGDYRWGRLHRVTMDHLLGGPFNIPPAFGAFPPPLADLPGIPTDGGFETVDASTHDARADAAGEFGFGGGPANRYVAELRALGDVRASSSLPGGTSGVPGTPFSVDLLPSWLTNDTFVWDQGPAAAS